MEQLNIKRQINPIPYYEDKERINRGLMVQFMVDGPVAFKKELDNPTIIDTEAMRKGIIIHEYILQEDDFWKNNIRQYSKSPSTEMQHRFAHRCIEEGFYDHGFDLNVATSIYKEIYKTFSLKPTTIDEKTTKLWVSVEGYVSEKAEHPDKTLIDYDTMQKLDRYKIAIKEHILADKLIYGYNDVVKFEEFHINWVHHSSDLACKCLLDMVHFDTKNKHALLVDLKTTSSVWGFKHSYDDYHYDLQLALYGQAVNWYIEHEMNENPADWVIEYYIVALDKISYEVRVFYFCTYDLLPAIDKVNMALDDIAWHIKNNKYDHSRAYYEQGGTERL